MDVWQDGETVCDECFGGGVSSYGIWQQVARVWNYLELDPLRAGDFASEFSDADSLVSSLCAGGVRQDGVFVPVKRIQDGLFVGVVKVESSDCDGDDLCSGCRDGASQVVGGSVFPGTGYEPGVEADASDCQGVVTHDASMDSVL